jgi:hypothetical protein
MLSQIPVRYTNVDRYDQALPGETSLPVPAFFTGCPRQVILQIAGGNDRLFMHETETYLNRHRIDYRCDA